MKTKQSITLFALTPECVVPPLSEFTLNHFVIASNTFGVLTSVPRIHR